MRRELEKFLREDLGLALSNVRLYLGTAVSSDRVALTQDDVARIVSYLAAIENRSAELAARIDKDQQEGCSVNAGVTHALKMIDGTRAA